MTDARYSVWLSLACGEGSSFAEILLGRFGTAKRVFEADEEVLREIFGDDDKSGIVPRLLDKNLSRADHILEYCEKNNVSLICAGDFNYPGRLRNIKAYPVVLYYKGTLLNLDEHLCVGMVGTRDMSDYGKFTAYNLSAELALCGAVIVSGMAKGIDSASHKGALAAHGFTAAVLGCGIDRCYPSENRRLMDAIIEKGVVFTEYPPGTEPAGKNFPQRNRIISGLSQAVVVVEAPLGSGALITAKAALSQGRQLFAVPGNVDHPNSRGAIDLIKNSALPVSEAYDILREYEHVYNPRINIELCRRYSAPQKFPRRRENSSYSKIANLSKREHLSVAANDKAVVKKLSLEELIAKSKASLDECENKILKIFFENPDKKFHPNDFLDFEIAVTDAANALVTLEIYGLVGVCPGGVYKINEE